MIEVDGLVGVLGHTGGDLARIDEAARVLGGFGAKVLVIFGDDLPPGSVSTLTALAGGLRDRDQCVYVLDCQDPVPGLDDAVPDDAVPVAAGGVGCVVEGVVAGLAHGSEGRLVATGVTFGVCTGTGTGAGLVGLPDPVQVLFSSVGPPAPLRHGTAGQAIPLTVPEDLGARFEFDIRLRTFQPRVTITPGPVLTDDALGYDVRDEGHWTRILTAPPVTAGGVAGVLLRGLEEIDAVHFDGHLEPLTHPVVDLGTVRGGVWELTTDGSTHLIDLDHRSWQRIPGHHARVYAPNTGNIRTMRDLRLGECGYVTLHGTNDIDYWWAQTSPIRRIRRTNPDDTDQHAGGGVDGGS